jgi:hypothetical protein
MEVMPVAAFCRGHVHTHRGMPTVDLTKQNTPIACGARSDRCLFGMPPQTSFQKGK